MLAFAKLENESRKERQRLGIPKAKARGLYKGRKSKLTLELKNRVQHLLYEKNYKKVHVAKLENIYRTTLYKICKEIEKTKN